VLRAESETQSGSGCVLSDLAHFFLVKNFLKLFPAISNSDFWLGLAVNVRELFRLGIGLSYKNSTLTEVTI
jgi:hypothetical protein